LQLENSNVAWTLPDERSTAAVPQVDLYFNYQVKPAVLKDKLKVAIGGKNVEYNVQTLSDDSRISLRLLGLKTEDKDLEALVTLDKGLVPEGGKNGTKETIENKLFIPSPYNLQINDVTSEHDGVTGTVYVRTSQPVVMTDIASSLHFNPEVKFSVEQ